MELDKARKEKMALVQDLGEGGVEMKLTGSSVFKTPSKAVLMSAGQVWTAEARVLFPWKPAR